MDKFRDKKNKFTLGAIFIVCFLFCSLVVLKNNFSLAQTSSDAIAIRIMPNADHLSALDWYKKQGFKGSPQSVTVDGYEGVRDGRTVYVNVGNVTTGATNVLYTNIYLISYNQEAEKSTTDIFSQVLSHWKFNANITTSGVCRGDNNTSCRLDDDCGVGDFCDSLQSRITRDIRRLSDIAQIKAALAKYHTVGYYPKLESGTYIPRRTLSVWPSWSEKFGKELGVNLPVDPVNRIGSCPGFNEDTCWNESSLTFASNLPSLPNGSLLYSYESTSGEVCAVTESGLQINNPPTCFLQVCLDFDGDGYGKPASTACVGHETETDCNDNNVTVFAGTNEVCTGGSDEDCDSFIDCADSDCAGNTACAGLSGCDFGGPGDCESGEDCNSCPSDCGACPVTCGDGTCDETCECGSCYDINGTITSHNSDCYCGDGRVCAVRGEECDHGVNNGQASDSCDINCKNVASLCVDKDSDGYDTCNLGVFGDDGSGAADCNDNLGTTNPSRTETCNGVDDDCNDGADEGFNDDNCYYTCTGHGYLWTGNNGTLNCCGNSPVETSVQANEKTPVNYCNDGIDNDCDGTYDDDTSNPTTPDTDCLACDAGNSIREDFWYVAGQPDCNQCNLNGDQRGDQTFGDGIAGDWLVPDGIADQCDADCNNQIATTVDRIQYHSSEAGYCLDGLDNNCDGAFDCLDSDCAATVACCTNECATAGTSCSGTTRQICSNTDSDPCLELQTVQCVAPTSDCFNGVCVTPCVDADNDNYSVTGGGNCCGASNDAACGVAADCNDSNPYEHPSIASDAETCDGYDNNCNGTADEGCDDDGDDYCDDSMDYYYNWGAPPYMPIAANPCPNTTSASNRDCEDNPAAGGALIYPGRPDICDSYDNDCNDATADGSGDTTTHYNTRQANICSGSLQTCSGGSWVDNYSGITGYYDVETGDALCADTIDNDCDGDDDCDDNSCDSSCTNTCSFTFTFPCTFP